MEIKVIRTSKGLSYEVEIPADYDSHQIFKDLDKQIESIETFFETDEGLNVMTLEYD